MNNDSLLKKVFRSFLTVSVISTLTATIGTLVDGIVTGQLLGSNAIAAFGLCTPVFIIMAAISGMFSTGGTAVCGQHIGRGDKPAASHTFTITIGFPLAISIIISILCVFLSQPIAALLCSGGSQGNLLQFTADYIQGLGFGVVPIMMAQILMLYMAIDNHQGLAFIAIVCMTTCNIVLDIFFTSVLQLGMFGMGLATSISYAVAASVCLQHFRRKDRILTLVPLKNWKKELKSIVATGFPSTLSRTCMSAKAIALNFLLLSLGSVVAVSAFSAQNTINQFLSAVTLGTGATTMLISSVFFGEKDANALIKSVRIALRTGLVLSIALGGLLFIFARPAVALIVQDAAVIEEGIISLRFLCLGLPLSLICIIFYNFFQGTNRLAMSNLICVTHDMLFILLVSFALMGVWGTTGVWASFLLGEIASLLMLYVVLCCKNKKLVTSWAELLLLDQKLTPEKKQILDISLNGYMGAVMDLSRQVSSFCSQFPIEPRKSTLLALCIEEIAGNIVCHGFHGSKAQSIDIKIIVETEQIILRIRDTAAPFNPLSYIDENADITDQLGLKMIFGLIRHVEYKCALQMNNLILII